MLPPRPSFSSYLVWSHIAELSQNIGAEGRGEGAVFERCNLRKPPSSGLLATFSHDAYLLCSTKHQLLPASCVVKQIMTLRILSGIPEFRA